MNRLSALIGTSFISALSVNSSYANPLQEAALLIEERLDARVGYAIYNSGNGESWLFNADERFPMVSTFKALACAALLAKADTGEKSLDNTIEINDSDLVTYAPVTKDWVGREVSLGDLCDATTRTSDNPAANKILENIGGPEGFTAFMRTIGDNITRLDRWETELNEGTPGDERDTTTPRAIALSLQNLLLGDSLSRNSREQLAAWLKGNEVGDPLLRAGIPKNWQIADRTGAGGHGTRGIIAVIWPPEKAPLVAAIYITETDATMDERNTAISQMGQALAKVVSP
ncbi:class A beta-lactamase [Rhizobium sp. Root483D2]|uniref:class A beta-lactamase n=1 Tax=Rhizobium sp. Root483D2 TaxID=1736545 RepID=UPI0007133388|nr:class A beta-lactamase [Rhizobium sp. Root483D2]KQY48589.1 class A beta-lactamase [Rhizobium sp. Root483D2]